MFPESKQTTPDARQRYELVLWCHDCKQGHHKPELCPSAGKEQRIGPFATVEDARRWVNTAAITKRAPWMFAVRDKATGELERLTGFPDSDWD